MKRIRVITEEQKQRAIERKKKWLANKRGPDWINKRGKHGNNRRGENHYRWNNEKLITSHGYVLVRVGRGHRLDVGNGYAYEHQINAEIKLGRNLAPNEVVHHIDGNKQNNLGDNLEIMTREEHNKHHLGTDNPRDIETGRIIGKKNAGRLLDGVEHIEFPEAIR